MFQSQIVSNLNDIRHFAFSQLSSGCVQKWLHIFAFATQLNDTEGEGVLVVQWVLDQSVIMSVFPMDTRRYILSF